MDSRRLWLLLPGPVRRLPADLAAVVLVVGLTTLAVLLPVVNDTPVRIVVGLPFVLFVPGYALIAALFPEQGSPPEYDDRTDNGGNDSRGIDGIERVALSFGTSIAVVPLVGLVLNFTPFGIRLVPIVVSVGGLTLALTAVAARRRSELPPDERLRVPYREWLRGLERELTQPDDRTDAVLNVLLVVSVLLAVSSVGYAVAVPKQGESFTEFYLLTEGADGELVADGYPTEFVRGESRSLVVGIGNQEHERVRYTAVVELQRVRVANNSTSVLESRELTRFSPTLEHNETWHRNHTIAPRMTGDRLRLTYLLYEGDAPADPAVETAYRELHLWVNVTAPDASASVDASFGAGASRSG